MRQTQHFFINEDLFQPEVLIEDRELLRQMKEVLRFRKGDECVLLDNKGTLAEASLEEFHNKGARFSIKSRKIATAPNRALRLFCGLPKKPSTFEWIVEKATELGVTDIYPLDTERSQVHELRKTERLKAIVKEASEQSERAFMPVLHELMTFEEFLKFESSGCLLAGDPWIYSSKLSELGPFGRDTDLVIGPEGGLTSQELKAIQMKGGHLFLLGQTVLRMETAVIASLSVIQYG